jgi:hypothetical protein
MRSRAGIYGLVVVLMAMLAIGAGCAKTPDDSQLTSQIQEKLSSDSGLQGKTITVQTAGGVATLSGAVENDAQRTAAARYAASIPGIKEVVNNLEVAPSGQMTRPVGRTARAARMEERGSPAAKPKASKLRSRPRPASDDSDEVAAAAPAPAMGAMSNNEVPAASAAPPAPSVPAPPPAPKKVTIPSGTTMAIRLVDAIDSETSQAGQSFRATLDSPLSVEGEVAIPSGYEVHGHIVDVKSAGKFAGKSELVLQLDRIAVGGKSYSIQTDQYRREGSSRGKNTAEKVGAGAAIGAIIGGLAGGGKGAGIGAAAGGGLGGGVQAATKGQQIKLPSETVLNFALQSPLTVTAATGPDAGRPKLDPPQ